MAPPLLLAALAPAQADVEARPDRAPAPSLAPEDFARWRKAIEPSAEDLAWRRIPWQAELGAALAAGRRADKPVMLWAMNGHPLGCV